MKQEVTLLDWVKFIVVMIVFIIGMIIMMIYDVHDPWVWLGYIAVWTWVEMVIAKNIHLKWWVWGLILLGLSVLDYIIIQMV